MKIFKHKFNKKELLLKLLLLIIALVIVSLMYLIYSKYSKSTEDNTTQEEAEEEINYIPELSQEYLDNSLDNLSLKYPDTWQVEAIINEDSQIESKFLQLSKDDKVINLEFAETEITGVFCSNTVKVKQLPNNWYRLKGKDEIRYSNRVSFDIKVTGSMAQKNQFNTKDDEWSLVAGETYKVCYKDQGILLADGKTVFQTPIISSDLDIETIIELDYIISSIAFVETVQDN